MNRAPRGSIRERIMVPYLVLVVAMVAVTGLACGGWAAWRAWEQGLERGRGIAETLRRSHFPLTRSVLDQLKGLGGAEFALVDEVGRVTSSTLGEAAEAPGIGPADGSDLSFCRSWSDGGTSYRVAIVERPGGPPPRPERLSILLPEASLRAAAWEAAGVRAPARAVAATDDLGAAVARWALSRLAGAEGTDLHGSFLAAVEAPLLRAGLAWAGGNQARLARRLGLHRTTLRQYGLDRSKAEG